MMTSSCRLWVCIPPWWHHRVACEFAFHHDDIIVSLVSLHSTMMTSSCRLWVCIPPWWHHRVACEFAFHHDDIIVSLVSLHSTMMTSSNINTFRVTGPFVRGTHRSPVNSPHKGQWRGTLILSLISLNKRLSKPLWRRWFETSSPSLWRYCNYIYILHCTRWWNPKWLLAANMPVELILKCVSVYQSISMSHYHTMYFVKHTIKHANRSTHNLDNKKSNR